MQCPKCSGSMRTYNRNGVQIEQCDTCRGIFLDFGELEHLSQMEARLAQPPAPPAAAAPTYAVPPTPPGYGAPAWGGHGGGHYYGHRKKSWAHMLFST